MDRLGLGGIYGTDVEIDLCFACHLLWLDKRESVHLAPGGTLELFRVLHEHRDDARHALADVVVCPRCDGRLKLTRDIGKGGRFSYYSCPLRHGRLTPFSEFLKEKQFVRSLNPAEKHRLRAEVKNVQCSGCGAPVDLANGFECDHCGSPITVLDADAVEKTLRDLDAAVQSRSGDPEEQEKRARALASMEALRTRPYDRVDEMGIFRSTRRGGIGLDLLSTSLGVLFGE